VFATGLSTRCVCNRLVASLSTSCNSVVISSFKLLQGFHSQLVDKLLKSWQQLLTNLLSSTSWEQAVQANSVDKLVEQRQHCYMSAAGLLQLVCFFTCLLTIIYTYYLELNLSGKRSTSEDFAHSQNLKRF
jgi:hypothetical protein